MCEEVVAHIFLVVGGRLDVHKRARQFEKIHSNQAFLDERNERKEPRGYQSGCHLSIALHPNVRMTVNRPWTCSPTTAASATAAISADDNSNHANAPFARASEADRNCLPRYSW